MDLWLQIRQLLEDNEHLLTALKIESQHAAEETQAAGTPLEHFLVNAIADAAAGYWAEKYAVPETVASSIEHAEAIGRAVRKHLATALLAAVELEPKRMRPTRSMAKMFCPECKFSRASGPRGHSGRLPPRSLRRFCQWQEGGEVLGHAVSG